MVTIDDNEGAVHLFARRSQGEVVIDHRAPRARQDSILRMGAFLAQSAFVICGGLQFAMWCMCTLWHVHNQCFAWVHGHMCWKVGSAVMTNIYCSVLDK